jgi:hypothetical protein
MAGPPAGMKFCTTSDLHHVETVVPVDGPTDLRLMTASRAAPHEKANEEATSCPPGRYMGRSRRCANLWSRIMSSSARQLAEIVAYKHAGIGLSRPKI